MFKQFKLYIYGAIAAIGMFLMGYIRLLSKQKESAKKEAQIAKNNVVVLETKAKDSKQLQASIDEVRNEAKQIEASNREKNKEVPESGDVFGDDRLNNRMR
jgi:hypothetical protein